MVAEEESFVTNATVPSFIEGAKGEDEPKEGVFVALLVSKLQNAVDPFKPVNMPLIETLLTGLLAMDLHLPGNSQAREDISGTPIIECLVKIMGLVDSSNSDNHFTIMDPGQRYYYPYQEMYSKATSLVGKLVSGRHHANIATCYNCNIIPILVDGLKGGKGNQYQPVEESASLLTLLKTDENPDKEKLLGSSSIKPIVEAMNCYPTRQDVQEWGCSKLKYIMLGWEETTSSDSAPEVDKTETKVSLPSAAGGSAPAPVPPRSSKSIPEADKTETNASPSPAAGDSAPAPAPAPPTASESFGSSHFGAPAPASFGNGQAPVFGSAATGVPVAAFGSKAVSKDSSDGGAFLNITPPDASGGTPQFAFGTLSSFESSTFGAAVANTTFESTGFGSRSQAPAPFGSVALTGGRLFGSSGKQAADVWGRRETPYYATACQDASSIMMRTISEMPAYQSKCPEKLRYGDYLQGSKGIVGALRVPTTGFGGLAPAPAPVPGFGASSFGAPAARAGFGGSGGPFGTAAPSGSFGLRPFVFQASPAESRQPLVIENGEDGNSEEMPADMGQAFLVKGAIDALNNTLTNCSYSWQVNREAISCIHILAQKNPTIRATLIKMGFARLLGAAMERWHGDETSNVQVLAQEALLVLLTNP